MKIVQKSAKKSAVNGQTLESICVEHGEILQNVERFHINWANWFHNIIRFKTQKHWVNEKGRAKRILNHEESPHSLRKDSSLNALKLGLRGFRLIKVLVEIGSIWSKSLMNP